MTIPLSVNGAQPSLSPPCAAQYLVNAEIACVPTERTMDEWRIAVYRAVMDAYRERSERYYAQTRSGESRAPARAPLANRQIERGALKNGCIALLLERMAMLTGGAGLAGSPPVAVVDEPRAVQFLDEALEWGEMAYSFQAGRGPVGDLEQFGAADDDLFTSFLQAQRARVLVPVQPSRLMAFLYFFAAGTIWDGEDGLVAVNPGDVALVDDLKHGERESGGERRVGASWEVVVPTAMQILDEAAGIAGAVIAVPEAAP